MATSISQTIIPILSENIPLHTCSRHEATKAVLKISQMAARDGKAYLSLAVKRCRRGNIDGLALATSNVVIIIILETRSPSSNDQLLIDLLSGPTCDSQAGQLTLVAFGMAPIAIQLPWFLESLVVGIDLSSSFEDDSRGRSCPSKLLTKVSSVVEESKVDALWATSCDTEASIAGLCLRAWITAWPVVFFCHNAMIIIRDRVLSITESPGADAILNRAQRVASHHLSSRVSDLREYLSYSTDVCRYRKFTFLGKWPGRQASWR